MIPSLILLAALAALGTVLYVHHRLTGGDKEEESTRAVPAAAPAHDPEVCCGLHEVCEKTRATAEIIYYDDEELDIYARRDPSTYTQADADRFRDVLLTLLPADIPGWAKSMEMRRIELPPDVREEMMLLLSEI